MRYDSHMKIFAGRASGEFAQNMCDFLGVPLGESSVRVFSEGNIYVQIGEKVRGMDVYIVQTIGLDPNNEMMELLFWLDAFQRSGANSVTAIIPYFSYAKADKKDEPRVSIRARVCADCLESAGVDRVVTMDLHSPQIQGFFKKPVDHLYAANLFVDYIQRANFGEFVIVAPDAGFAKNAKYYSNKLGVPLAIGDKQRLSHDEKAEVIGLIGDVEGQTAVIVDDMVISGGTLIETAKFLISHGAADVYAFASHCLMNQNGREALINSPIKRLVTTDTVCNENIRGCDKIEVLPVSGLFAKAVKIIHERDSLSDLFI